MSKRKKKFPCGHTGFGQVCHRCAQKQTTREQKKQQKYEWEKSFAQDPIDLRSLPRNVVTKARKIMRDLQDKKSYRDFHGKRLRHNRLVISIPVTRNYRLICRDSNNLLIPEQVVSHEDYNVCKPGS